MSSAQTLMAQTMGAHRSYYNHGDDCDRCTGCNWRGHAPNEHEAHVAAEIDKALGGLTRKRRIDHQWRETGEVHHDRFFEGKPVPKTRLHYVQQSRWASDWTVTE